ncbi:MAG: hypothetical protein GYA78_04120 [Caldisericales bacterium]|jgi:hypothetical protein|nr:hypothetical protein [Caldisericia bacterium]NMD14519.1 hypothetical protein [Caldisericales bacterium]
MRSNKSAIHQAITALLLAFLFLSSCSKAVAPDTPRVEGRREQIGPLSIAVPKGFIWQTVGNKSATIKGGFEIRIELFDCQGLKEGDLDSLSPIIQKITQELEQEKEAQIEYIGGKQCITLNSDGPKNVFYAAIFPLESQVAAIYTNKMPLKKTADMAIQVIRSTTF